jgi:hypothetical protein
MSANNEIKKSGVYAPEVLEFVRVANEYCTWLEEEAQDSALTFIHTSTRLLSKVYYHAACLNETEPLMEGGNEKFVTEQDWSSIFQKILNLLGSHNDYLRIADSSEFDRSDLVTHTISEDLADIYQDLKDFTLQYRQGIEEIMNDAVWEVMDNFENFWSVKLLNALKALNKLYVSKTDPQSELEPSEDSDENGNNPGYDNSFFTRLQDLNEEDI